MGKKSTPAQPAAPDPYRTAAAQGTMNRETAVTQANLNRINQRTPDGSITYNQIGRHADGTPQYEQVMELSPQQRALYDQQNSVAQALGGLAQNNVQRVSDAQNTPFNFDSMTPLSTVSADPNAAAGIQTAVQSANGIQSGLDYSNLEAMPSGSSFNDASQRASDAVYGQATSRLDPRFQQQEADMRTRLINSGISENSSAFQREMGNFSRDRNDAYNQAQYSAVAAGMAAQDQGYRQALGTRQQGVSEINTQGAFANAAQDQGYQQNLASAGFNNAAVGQQNSINMQNQLAEAGFNNAARQQEIGEASYLRNLPLNDIAALMGTGGGVQQPQFNPVAQVGVASPDLQGAIYQNYNAQMNQYSQAQANRSAGLGSIFGLAGSLGSAAIMSDKRVKHNIQRVGTLVSGLPTYVFSYLGSKVRHFGIMAQEGVERGLIPHRELNGVMVVKYSELDL